MLQFCLRQGCLLIRSALALYKAVHSARYHRVLPHCVAQLESSKAIGSRKDQSVTPSDGAVPSMHLCQAHYAWEWEEVFRLPVCLNCNRYSGLRSLHLTDLKYVGRMLSAQAVAGIKTARELFRSSHQVLDWAQHGHPGDIP